MSLVTLFDNLKTTWKKSNSSRSEDYILGGTVALLNAKHSVEAWLRGQPSAAAAAAENTKLKKELNEALARNREYRERQDGINQKNDELQAALTAALNQGVQNNQGQGANHEEVVRLRKENRSLKEGARTMKENITNLQQALADRNTQLKLVNEQLQQLKTVSTGPTPAGYVKQSQILKMMKRLEMHTMTATRSFENRLQMILLSIGNYQHYVTNPDAKNREDHVMPELPLITPYTPDANLILSSSEQKR